MRVREPREFGFEIAGEEGVFLGLADQDRAEEQLEEIAPAALFAGQPAETAPFGVLRRCRRS